MTRTPAVRLARRLRRRCTPLEHERVVLGLTQKHVAEAVGVNQAHLSLLERGLREPSIGTARAFAAFYGRTVEFLFPGEP
jgi:transcriptional regulator with XRE-family HTH domain